MSDEVLRVAVIGCGRMGARSSEGLETVFPDGWLPLGHAEVIQATAGLDLVAVCDQVAPRAKQAAQRFGPTTVYEDYRVMIETERPDIISIATRTVGRCEMIRHAAEHGVRGIHAEKPLGRSLAEHDTALDAVEANGVKFSYGTTRRFMAIYRHAQEMIRAGDIGEVIQITVEFGRTWLLWNHPHSIDLLLYYADCRDAVFVQANLDFPPDARSSLMLDADPELEWGHVRFANGVLGAITCATGFNVRIAGTQGQLSVNADGTSLRHEKLQRGKDVYHLAGDTLPVDPRTSGTRIAFEELRDAVRNNSETAFTPADVRCAGEILIGMAWSGLHEGRRTSLNDIPKDFTVTGKLGANRA